MLRLCVLGLLIFFGPVLSAHFRSTLCDLEASEIDNSTAPYVFNTLASLMRQWPNTYHPNGHTIIPGVLEPFTLLYHARKDKLIVPPSPEWFAFDSEMSYGIMAGMGGQTFMFTYQTNRPAKIIYFDGMSAALSMSGWLDSQEVFLRGKGKNNGEDYTPFDEYGRAANLCRWGLEYGIEGYIRMNAGFELMWCNFSSPSIQLVSYLNITPPGTPPGAPILELPPVGRPRTGTYRLPRQLSPPSPLAYVADGDWLRAAAHRSVVPQPQVQLDYSAFVSFYHPRLQSLVSARQGQTMRQHRIWPNISDSDAKSVVQEVRSVLLRSDSANFGFRLDWGDMATMIIDKWADRILQLHVFLDNATSVLEAGGNVNLTETLLAIRRLTYSPLNIYIDTTAVSSYPSKSPNMTLKHYWDSSSYHRCVFSATVLLLSNPTIPQTPQETLLRASVEAVQSRICLEYGAIFTESMDTKNAPDQPALMVLLYKWRTRLNNLMGWLDWPDWLRCDDLCPSDSVCVMPLWPLNMLRVRPGTPEQSDDPEMWKPRCEKLDFDKRHRRYHYDGYGSLEI
ncbi:hypothetical protein CERSUDRAFT_121303 [Gelatoporia subvermispora B]|uniref:Uncharacterized protein n=1 Tax=Ceriporiopsis subvermispora (strain B) TaxID=914234 RepID=M2RP07_CERS8|nr:hypothetical protein CERSUDRAFT_121303 [Gelatoporia subvermispora B]